MVVMLTNMALYEHTYTPSLLYLALNSLCSLIGTSVFRLFAIYTAVF
jgi:hypothetical protein